MMIAGAVLPLVAAGALLLAILVRRVRIGVADPIAVGTATLIWYYVADALFLVLDHQIAGQFALSRRVFQYVATDVVIAQAMVVSLCLGWAIGYLAIDFRDSEPDEPKPVIPVLPPGRVAVVCGVVFVLGGFALFAKFVESQGGLLWYLANIAARASIFRDAGLVWALLQAATIVLSLLGGIVLSETASRRRAWFVGAGLLCGGAVIISLLMGARANVARVVAIAASVYHFTRAPLVPNRKLAVAGLIGLLLLIAYARVTRPSEGVDGVGAFFNSVETSQTNALFLIATDGRDGETGGATVAAAFLAFVPRRALDAIGIQKPRGANSYFTTAYWPSRWSRTRSEVSIGLGAELLLNFGYLGPLLGGTLFGWLVAWGAAIVNNGKRRMQMWFVGALNAALLWFTFQSLRGDLFNAVNNLAVFAFGITLTAGVLRLDNSARRIFR